MKRGGVLLEPSAGFQERTVSTIAHMRGYKRSFLTTIEPKCELMAG